MLCPPQGMKRQKLTSMSLHSGTELLLQSPDLTAPTLRFSMPAVRLAPPAEGARVGRQTASASFSTCLQGSQLIHHLLTYPIISLYPIIPCHSLKSDCACHRTWSVRSSMCSACACWAQKCAL